MRSASPHARGRQEIELQRRKCRKDVQTNLVISTKQLITHRKDVYKKIYDLARAFIDQCRTKLALNPIEMPRGSLDVRLLTRERKPGIRSLIEA